MSVNKAVHDILVRERSRPRHTIRALGQWAQGALTLSGSSFRIGTGTRSIGNGDVTYKETKKYPEGAASFRIHDPSTGAVLRVTIELIEQGGPGR